VTAIYPLIAVTKRGTIEMPNVLTIGFLISGRGHLAWFVKPPSEEPPRWCLGTA
jgi:hypothetical protein